MPSELRQRKKGDQESKDKKNEVDQEKKSDKKPEKPEKPVKTETKSSKWSILWYLISPCFACYFTMKARDPWTKPDRSRTEKIFRNLGPGRTRANKFLKISDQLGPIGGP